MNRRGAVWLALALAAALAVGCERDDRNQETPSGEEPAAASTAPSEECSPDAGTVIRGRVLVPASERGRDTLVGGRLEQPGRNIPVVVYRHGNRESILAEAETDASGEWCAELPVDASFGVELIAEAEYRDTVLRRSIIAEFGQTISVRSEALHRILEDRDPSHAAVSRAAYLNMQAVASTAVDLLDPVRPRKEESPDALAERMKQRLLEDRRLRRSFGDEQK